MGIVDDYNGLGVTDGIGDCNGIGIGVTRPTRPTDLQSSLLLAGETLHLNMFGPVYSSFSASFQLHARICPNSGPDAGLAQVLQYPNVRFCVPFGQGPPHPISVRHAGSQRTLVNFLMMLPSTVRNLLRR